MEIQITILQLQMALANLNMQLGMLQMMIIIWGILSVSLVCLGIWTAYWMMNHNNNIQTSDDATEK